MHRELCGEGHRTAWRWAEMHGGEQRYTEGCVKEHRGVHRGVQRCTEGYMEVHEGVCRGPQRGTWMCMKESTEGCP